MCWSFGASAILAILGVIVAVYLALKKKSKLLWIPILYFSLMELLQAITYLSINDCSLPMNQLLTFLGYIHIAFQPFFANAITMYFIPKHVREKIQGWVYAVCFIGVIIMLTKLYPFDWAEPCVPGVDALCGTNLCSTDGNWHLAWYIPLNDLGLLGYFGYLIPAFVLPLIYGAWRVTLYGILLGPALAYLTTGNPNEWPAVWCLFSIAYILMILIKPVMNWLHVKKWYFWKYPFKKS